MKLKFLILFFFELAFMSVKAQTMYARPIIGAQTAYPVANIQKLTFSGGNLVVTNLTGANGTFALSGNRYLNFTDLTLATPTNEFLNNRFYVYPNPVTTVLNITNQDSNQTISHLEIISLEGQVVLAQSTPQIAVASLPQGMYFCRITTNNQTQTIKFLKQ